MPCSTYYKGWKPEYNERETSRVRDEYGIPGECSDLLPDCAVKNLPSTSSAISSAGASSNGSTINSANIPAPIAYRRARTIRLPYKDD